MLDTSGILSNHLQKLANGNLALKLRDNEYTEVERLLSSISKRKLKQALEEVNFDVYEVLVRDLTSNDTNLIKHASSVLSSFLVIKKGSIKDKKTLLGILVNIVVKNKSLDDNQPCCDVLKCIRILVDTEDSLGNVDSLESFISEQLDVSSDKPERLVIESLLLFKAMLECNLLDLRDKTSSWLKCLLDRMFDKNPDVRVSAIGAFNIFKPWLTGNEKYLDDLENSLIKSRFSKLLIELLPSDKNWAVIWRLLLELMGKRFHHNSSLVNSLLAVEEKAFKSFHVDTKKEAFINWKTVILSFASDRSVLTSERRVKLLAIPLRANNCRSLDIALAKFDTWWFLLANLQSDVSRYIDLVLTSFLRFCFGPFSDPSLPSTNGSNMLNNVSNGETLGRLYPAVRVPCMQALTQILCYSAGSTLPPHLTEDLVIMPLTDPPLKSGQDFCSISRILTQCVGEVTMLTTSDADFAWVIESWRSLLILINRGSGETSCFDETNSKDVKNISLVKDVLRLLVSLVENVLAVPESKMYGKVLLLMIEALCVSETAFHPSVLNSHVYSVGNSQLMTGSPTLLLASLMLSPTLMNSKTDQKRYMMVFSNLLSLGLSSLAPPLSFIRVLLKKLEALTASEEILSECLPMIKQAWVSIVNQLSDIINKDGTVSEGNDAHHDFQCIYGLLMFPIAHFLKTDCQVEAHEMLLKPWEKLFQLFFINSQFIITTQACEVVEELCKKILVFVKKSDTSLTYISHLVDYVLIIYKINFYEEYWKSTAAGLALKGERSTLYSSRQLLYVLFYKICDLISSLEGGSEACSEKHASIISYLVLVLSIGLNHDLLGFLFEKAAASVRFYLELTVEKCPKSVENEMIRLWEKFLDYVGKKVISQKKMSQYHIDVMVPLLEAGFQHSNVKMVELTKSLWNKTLGEQFSDVTIPQTLTNLLENVLRDETESEVPDLIAVKDKVSTSPFKRPVLQKNISDGKKTVLSNASTFTQGNNEEFVVISPRQKSSVLTDHQKEKMKSRREDIPALYQDLTQDSVSQSLSQEITSSVVEPSLVDLSEDANPPFPKAPLKKYEYTAVKKDSLSSIAPERSCVTKRSRLQEDKKEGEKETVSTESIALKGRSYGRRRQLLKDSCKVDDHNLLMSEKSIIAKDKNEGSSTNDSSLKENKAPEFRCIQSEVKSDLPSVAALIQPSNEENVVKSASIKASVCKMAIATKDRNVGKSVSSSSEEKGALLLTCNESEPASADVSSTIKPDITVSQTEESEPKKIDVLSDMVANETSEVSSDKAEKNLLKEVASSKLIPSASVDKCKTTQEPSHPTQHLVENTVSNDLKGLQKEVNDDKEEEITESETSKPDDALSVEKSPIIALSRNYLRKSSRGKIPLDNTPLPTSSDSTDKPQNVSKNPNSASTGPVELRRKSKRPSRLGTPSPISHIRKISLQQHKKRLSGSEEIKSTPKDESQGYGKGKNEDKELLTSEKAVSETVSTEEGEVNSERNKEDGNISKKVDSTEVVLDKKVVEGNKTTFESPKKLPVLESPCKILNKDTSSCSSSPKPNQIESPKHKSPILSGSLDDWVIVKRTGNADKAESDVSTLVNSDVPAAADKLENDSSSEFKTAVCISPPGDLVESSQEPLSPGKSMTKNCSVNLSRIPGIFASETAEVAFIAYQGSVIKCNLSPSKKEDKDQRKVNGASVATNLFPSPRSKTGRGARMLNLAQGNKEEGARSPLLDIKSPQEPPKQLVVKEGECSTPPMKKPRRIRPVQIGNVSPQYHSLENGCVVLDGDLTIHEYSPSASPKSSLMKKRKAVQEVGEDSPSSSAKRSRRVSFADPIVSKHVEFCIPESERKFKKRTVNRCLKMPSDEEMDQANSGLKETSEEESVPDASKSISTNDSPQSSDVVKIKPVDSSNIEQQGAEPDKELPVRKTSEVAPIPSLKVMEEAEENIVDCSASISSKETSLEKSSPESAFMEETSSHQPVSLIGDNSQKATSDICDENSSKKHTSDEAKENSVSDSEKIEATDQPKSKEFPFEVQLVEEACPELWNCSDPINEDLWEKLTSRIWRERCKAHLASMEINTVGDLGRLTESQMANIPFKNKKWKTLVDTLKDYKRKKDEQSTPEVPLETENTKESDSNGDLRIFREMLSKLSPEEIVKELKLCSSEEDVRELLIDKRPTPPPKDFVSVATECMMNPKDILVSALKEGNLKETMEELSNEERIKLIKWVCAAAKKSAISTFQPIRDILSCALGEIRCENGNSQSEKQFQWLFQNAFLPDEQMECISLFLSSVDSDLLSLFIFEDEEIMRNVHKSITPLQALQIMIRSISQSNFSLPKSELDKLEDILDKQRSSEDLVNRFTSKILQRLPKTSDKH